MALRTGDRLHGFVVRDVEALPEFEVTAVTLAHEATGAHWLHLDAADTNNAFHVAFKTTPTDSTGVAHVLEHSVLCGSERFPVRDPFFNMLKRSLSTYMNAMTGPDYTVYPFATQNADDYSNLLKVYLDACFYPTLDPLDFQQEGHRLEFERGADASSALQRKGVVLNEMKGAMAPHAARYTRELARLLYPTSTYHHNSGGEPSAIPELTHDALKAFHATHYHPSNARFFSYGDLPLEATLAAVQRTRSAVRLAAGRRGPRLEVRDERGLRRRAAPKSRCQRRRSSSTRKADLRLGGVAAAPRVGPGVDGFEEFALAVASDLMLSGADAAFHAPLLASGLGAGFAPGTGYGGSRRETSFAVGLRNVAPADVPEVESRIHATFAKIADEGFPAERVAAVTHQVELGAREVSTSFGLGVGLSAVGTWIHGGDPLRPLRAPELARRLEAAAAADDSFWQTLVKSGGSITRTASRWSRRPMASTRRQRRRRGGGAGGAEGGAHTGGGGGARRRRGDAT